MSGGIAQPKNKSAGTPSTTAGPTPIGVPAGYSTQQPGFAGSGYGNAFIGNRNTIQTPPYYNEGDQYLPASTLGPDEKIDLQRRMEAAGLYSGDYTLGVWGSQDVNAYEQLLATANYAGRKDAEGALLNELIAAPKREKKAARAPLTIRLSNPDDIKALAKKTALELYGGNIDDATTQAITDAIHSSETNFQTSAYNAAETGGAVTESADPSTIAEQKIREEKPNEVAAFNFGSSFRDVLSTMTNNASGYQSGSNGMYG